MKRRPWVAFFSQTGTEIVDITESLGIDPDIVVTNERPDHLRTINRRITNSQKIVVVPNKPTEEEIQEILSYYDNPIVTLHGWLRIMPPAICEKYTIFNGHPGLITEYPELKGKDPQVKSHELGHEVAGAVLHRVTAGVDEGPIISEERFNAFELSLDDLFRILANRSLYMWTEFLDKALWLKE